MKLVVFLHQETLHLGAILKSDRVVNLPLAFAAFKESHDGSLPTDPFPTSTLALLQQSDTWWEPAAATVRWLENGGADTLSEPAVLPLDAVKLTSPLANPSKVICIGLNYYDHCRETNTPVPEKPVSFVKYASAIVGPDDPITWSPEESSQVDYEAELALVIKRRARGISAEEALDYVAGYVILNDISARDVQFSEGQWVRAKSFDSFCPLGPYLVSADEVGDPHQLGIRCRVNGELLQDSNTSELIFNIPAIIAYISKSCTLMPGDIISTGTPHGTGAFRKPPIYLQPGDVVEVEIDKLGVLRNPVA